MYIFFIYIYYERSTSSFSTLPRVPSKAFEGGLESAFYGTITKHLTLA